jgi:3-(3-hydroxy-phenyl)propionate hydroxylase
VLFAGDAAHLVPIFGARRQPVDDADLAWKLACRQGLASDRLPTAIRTSVFATQENLSYGTKSTNSWRRRPRSS